MVRTWRFAAPVALAACGLLLVTSARAADGGGLRVSDVAELSDVVRAAELRTQELSESAERLTAEVEALTDAKPTGGQDLDGLDELVALAGLTAVEGPGLRVTLDDAPMPAESALLAPGTNVEDYLVHQQDLDAVMNALWAGGAEAMMVMDQRIISTSSVRCVGPVLFLQGTRYAPPYTVTAIGDVASMMAALDESDSVRTYRSLAELIGLGFELTTEETIAMPAYEGPLGVAAERAG